jgi:hypothetical protein
MAVLLVSYDLTAPGRNYDDLIEAIKSHNGWAHPLKSVWFVSTQLTPAQLRDELKATMDSNDKILVVDTTNDPAAWSGLPDDVSAWIKKNL